MLSLVCVSIESSFVYLGLFHRLDGKRQLGVNTNLGALS